MRFEIPVLAAIGLIALAGVAFRAQSPSLLLAPDDPAFSARAPARFFVRLSTNKGLILLDVERRLAPHGVDRFYNLVRHGFYDAARFFRVVKPRFAQFGVPADPAVGHAWRNRTIPDDPRLASSVRGAVSYAFAVPNGRTTQVYINLQDNAQAFDQEPFVPFAHVMDGMDVADGLNGEYGESAGGGIRAGKQDALFTEGNALLQREYPRLDFIIRATVE